MERELVELFEKVKKAADAAAVGDGTDSIPEENRCLDALRRLKDFPVTYEVLVSSQVGKRLRQLVKHPRKKIQSLASEVVEIWKNIIIKETTKSKKNGNIENEGPIRQEPASLSSGQIKRVQRANSIKVEDPIKAESAGTDSDDSRKSQRSSSLKIEKVSAAGSVKVEGFNRSSPSSYGKPVKIEKSTIESKVESPNIVKTGKSTHVAENYPGKEKQSANIRKSVPDSGVPKLTSIPQTKDKTRDKVREILAEALCKVSTEVGDDLQEQVDACDPYRVAVLVETVLFEKWGKSTGPHNHKYRSLTFNIKDPNNRDFRRKVLVGHFPPDSVVELTAEDMASDERRQQNEKIKEKALFDCERGIQQKASTDQFKCLKCGKRETTYYQLQIRSADEPMTAFITCVNCNNRWKQG